jgi:hypothetical protein
MKLEGTPGFPMIAKEFAEPFMFRNAHRDIRINAIQCRLLADVLTQTPRVGTISTFASIRGI